jgi:hypothetical protein
MEGERGIKGGLIFYEQWRCQILDLVELGPPRPNRPY